MTIKSQIPNTITLGNLFCGCLALVNAFEGQLIVATYFIGASLIFDFFDGFIARLLKVASPIGKDLDSLADMVTFGVVPGVIMFQLIKSGATAFITDGPASSGWTIDPPFASSSSMQLLPFFGFIIVIFSCIRLARFNNDTRQSEGFIGLPTPANTMIVCSIPLITNSNLLAYPLLLNPITLCIISLVLSFLLIAELPLLALKFKNFAWKGNQSRYLLLISSLILIVCFQFTALPLIMALYILLSIVNNIFLKKRV